MKLEQPLRRLSSVERERIIRRVRSILEGRGWLGFAYVYGSILSSPLVRDVDVAVWLVEPRDPLLEISEAESLIEEATGLPADVVVLNLADTMLRYHVFTRGRLLFVRRGYRVFHDRLVAATILEYSDVRLLNSLAEGKAGLPDTGKP